MKRGERASAASLTAVDLPRLVWALGYVQRDRTGCDQGAAMMAADFAPSRMWYPRNAAVQREPFGRANRCRLAAAV